MSLDIVLSTRSCILPQCRVIPIAITFSGNQFYVNYTGWLLCSIESEWMEVESCECSNVSTVLVAPTLGVEGDGSKLPQNPTYNDGVLSSLEL